MHLSASVSGRLSGLYAPFTSSLAFFQASLSSVICSRTMSSLSKSFWMLDSTKSLVPQSIRGVQGFPKLRRDIEAQRILKMRDDI